MDVEKYINNPCGTYAIPFWKQKSMILPNNMMIIHHSKFNSSYLENFADKQYFKLLHDLKDIYPTSLKDTCYYFQTVNINTQASLVKDIINSCYEHISVDEIQVLDWTKEITYDKNLWILVIDKFNDIPVALGIANFDAIIKEGSLEWIQVLPNHRYKGIGQLIVNELLYRLKAKASFVTVSGEIDNITQPERLYRKCGFSGNDIWHILYDLRKVK